MHVSKEPVFSAKIYHFSQRESNSLGNLRHCLKQRELSVPSVPTLFTYIPIYVCVCDTNNILFKFIIRLDKRENTLYVFKLY